MKTLTETIYDAQQAGDRVRTRTMSNTIDSLSDQNYKLFDITDASLADQAQLDELSLAMRAIQGMYIYGDGVDTSTYTYNLEFLQNDSASCRIRIFRYENGASRTEMIQYIVGQATARKGVEELDLVSLGTYDVYAKVIVNWDLFQNQKLENLNPTIWNFAGDAYRIDAFQGYYSNLQRIEKNYSQTYPYIENEVITVAVPATGATGNENTLTIPTGQTGQYSYISSKPNPVAPDSFDYIGREIRYNFKVEVDDYNDINPIFAIYCQRYIGGVYDTNVTFDSVSVVKETIDGSVMTVEYTAIKIITQGDIDSGFTYGGYIRLNNTTPATANALITDFTTLTQQREILKIVESQNELDAKRTELETAVKKGDNLDSMFVGEFSVKKDGSGDYTDIQSAINAAAALATAYGWYKVVIHDDWIVTDYADLIDYSGSKCIFYMLDYVMLECVTQEIEISLYLPNNSTDSEIEFSQPFFWDNYCWVRNLTSFGKNCRYIAHRDDKLVNINKLGILSNCILDHKGNDEANTFPASVWKSDFPVGHGSGSGERILIHDCKLVGRRATMTSHTNVDFANPSHVTISKTSMISRFPDDKYNSEEAYVISILEFGSGKKCTFDFEDCTLSAGVKITYSYYTSLNRTNAHALVPSVNIKGCNPVLIKQNVINPLVFTSVNNNENIQVTGGTAFDDIFGKSFKQVLGYVDSKGIDIGIASVADDKNAYIDNYIDTLGHLLGDCSTVNKTLTIDVNSVEQTVTFNQNYAGSDPTVAPLIDTATILADINSQLTGIAVVSNEYTPDLPCITNQNYLYSTSASESIKKGMGFVFDVGLGGVRRSLPADTYIDGIAIEDMPATQTTGYDLVRARGFLRGEIIDSESDYSPNVTSDAKGTFLKPHSTNSGDFETTLTESEAVIKGVSTFSFKIL